MNTYILLYNIIKIKSDINSLITNKDDRFILLANNKCLDQLSPENKSIFKTIIHLQEFNLKNVEEKLSAYFLQRSAGEIKVMTNEESCAIICAQLRERYQLSGPKIQDILPFVDKVVMKEKLKAGNIKMPHYVHFNYDKFNNDNERYLQEIEKNIGYPMLAKPTNSVGSINTKQILSLADLRNYVEINIPDRSDFEIDEFIEGKLCHSDGLIKNNQILFFQSCAYNTPCLNFTKGAPLGSILIFKDTLLKNKISLFAQKIIKALEPPDGAFHLEFFIKGDELIFLEMAARSPGALAIPTYQKMFGINLEEQHYRLQMGLPYLENLHNINEYSAWIIFPKQNGMVENLNTPQIKSEININYLVDINQEINNASSIFDAAVEVIISNKSYEVLREDFISLQAFEPVVYKRHYAKDA